MNEIAQSQRRVLTRRGGHWTLYSIRQILHNPAGFRRWDGYLVKSGHAS